MGGNESKSTVNNLVNNHVINKSVFESFNKSVTNYMAESLVKVAQSCSNSTVTLQEIKLQFGNIGGDLDITGLSQDTRAIINLQCISKTTAQNKMANDIVNKILDSVNASNDTSLLAQLDAIAKQSQSTSGSGGIANTAKSETNNITFNEVQNITETHLQNVVENNVSMKMSTNIAQDIINKSVSNQIANVTAGDVGGSVRISNISQQLTIDSVVKAIQDTNIVGDIINNIVKDLGGQVVSDSTTGTSTTETGKSESTQKTTGIIEEAGNAISKIASAFTGPFLWIAIAIGIFIFIIIVLIVVKLFSSGSSQDGSSPQVYYGVTGDVGQYPTFPIEYSPTTTNGSFGTPMLSSTSSGPGAVTEMQSY